MSGARVEGEAPPSAGATPAFTQAAILIVVGIVATTLAQTQVLGLLPIRNLLKNELHVSRSALSGFVFLSALPWYFKPLSGIITDAFPFLGSRRRNYLVVSSTLAALTWLGVYFTPHKYGQLLGMMIVLNTFMVFASTVVGGFLVATAQSGGSSGRLTSVREAASLACVMISGPISGYLASIDFGWTAASCGAVAFLLAPTAFFMLRDDKAEVDSGKVLEAVGFQLKNVIAAPTLWAAAGLLLLVFVAPGFQTALFYLQQNQLHMSTNAGPGLPGFLGGQGFLNMIIGAAGVVASGVYALACRRFRLRTLLAMCIGSAALVTLGYLHYTSATDARIMAGADGFTSILAEVALMDLAVRATPRGSEGLGYALMISVRNVALFGTDFLGSLMLDKWHLPFAWLVTANALTTAAAVPLVLLLPGTLVRRRDAELYQGAAEPDTQIQV